MNIEKQLQDVLYFLKQMPSCSFVEPYLGMSDNEICIFWVHENLFIDAGFLGDEKYSFYGRDMDVEEFFGDDIPIEEAKNCQIVEIINSLHTIILNDE